MSGDLKPVGVLIVGLLVSLGLAVCGLVFAVRETLATLRRLRCFCELLMLGLLMLGLGAAAGAAGACIANLMETGPLAPMSAPGAVR